ncbi:laminin subunit beta-1-like [Anneissia japonica]|uniref:laminin subunit beta-1-like n=1 Tax=Anneissia japonica TaxID=1529436 RepID=UPI0014256B99|nr:laminin subunit beta-1-like [Anneissia japonica]XP_033106489.1 laminin subunit beta-1-like [Anneissia japonica]
MLFYVLGIVLLQALGARSQGSCEGESCYPATGDLLIGRESRLSATSTCGTSGPEPYCIVSHLQDDKKCFYCDSTRPWKKTENERSHRIANIVTSFDIDRKNKWWQSVNGVNDVSIRLDLEAMFHFTHLVMTFKTFRPAAMIVERSSDFGRTWNIYRYFAYDCDTMFPGVQKAPLRKITDVVCEERYSNVEPSTDGEVIFRVLPPHIQSQITDPYSDEVQDLIKITNLRLNFTRLHTLGDVLLDDRPEITEKYYYALYDMIVRGSCHCYGHAHRCIPISGDIEGIEPHQVYGNCDCKHNTEGLNCERCKPFHNDQPWRPAQGLQTHACKLCNCNQHTTKCHFDPAVYEQTGGISGGVCDDCTHNTMGRNCEQCLPFYYMDPTRDIRDPNICRRCDCDPNGSEMGGECESRSDPMMNLEAGRCLCKRYVTGQRCDTCMNGHWNLRRDNPEGCEACTCNTLGTIGNQGCDKQTGNCVCKRLVTGRSCDECYDNFYGLSDDPEGCQNCDCNPGGSYNTVCDKITGQCPCRPNIIGRRCDTVKPGYFITYMDYLLYEAEYSRLLGVLGEIEKRVQPIGVVITWTGTGFVEVKEGSILEFNIDNIPYSGNYELLIRYEPQLQANWENIRITLVRPRPVDTSSICGNTIPSEDQLAISLSSTNRYRSTYPSVLCLESGEQYTIRIEFESLITGQSRPNAVIRIDSIALLPQPVNLPPFSEGNTGLYRLEQWEYYTCMDSFYRVDKQSLQQVCEELLFIISTITYNGGIDCACDPTGSTSNICAAVGGQCSCKPNVVGRTCDRCAPGTFGFGPNGCTACACNMGGSKAEFCDSATGICPCMPNVCGRNCDSCCSGYFNFPNCQVCTCNGHATECEAVGGACQQCQDNTDGFYCERCRDGFYGDPRIGTGQRCQPCLCPSGVQSGIQHANTCYLDNQTQTVICNCYPEFDGIRCDRCANNYYGDPTVLGGGCSLCDCNGNTDLSLPGNCMAETGECTNCLYNTAGPHCEICATDYYGDALLRSCRKCSCSFLGTDTTVCDFENNCGVCNRVTGQCPCLPNVLGRQCDTCEENYWRLASGMGCEACNCCPQGSVSLQCNEFSGQCSCQDGFGGRDCCSCQNLYFGDPLDANIGCTPCDCNPDGSDVYQCRNDGTCVCRDRVTGAKCDRCAIGTKGNFPYCDPCGECYDNWFLIIQELRIETDNLIAQAANRSSNFTSGAFAKNFTIIEKNMQEIRDILDGFGNNTGDRLEEYEEALRQIQRELESNADELDKISGQLVFVELDTESENNRIDRLNASAIDLANDIKKLEQDLRNLTRIDIEEALKIIYESRDRANAAQQKVNGTANTVAQSAGVRQQVEDKIAQLRTQFNNDLDGYRQRVDAVENDIQDLEQRIIDLNTKVCGSPGDSCGSCGGAGCGTCGGLGCNAALSIANQAKERAQLAQNKFAQKEIDANNILGEVQGAEGESEVALEAAQKAYDAALRAKEDLGSVGQNLSRLVEDIIDALNDVDGAKPQQVEDIARETLAIQISLTPEEIKALADEIQQLVDSLDNIEQILNDTRDDLLRVTELEQRADEAKQFAESVKALAEYVNTALDNAKEDQKEAGVAIDNANADIRDAKGSLTAIESEVNSALIKANASLTMVQMMQDTLKDLSFAFTDNKNNIQTAAESAENAALLANATAQEAEELQQSFDTVKKEIDAKASRAAEFRQRAEVLLEGATLLEADTKSKLSRLRDLDDDFKDNKILLDEHTRSLEALKARAASALSTIQERARFYESCTI